MSRHLPSVDFLPADAPAFDYAQLDVALADRARDVAETIRQRRTAEIREAGALLLEMKEAMPHGAFGPWCLAELRLNDRSAQRYMAAARFLDGKPDTLTHLPATTLYKLASPTTPPEVVEQVLQAAARPAPDLPERVQHILDVANAERNVAKLNRGLSPEQVKERVAKRRQQERAQREAQQHEAEQRRALTAQREAEGRDLLLRLAADAGDALREVQRAKGLLGYAFDGALATVLGAVQ